MSAIPAARVGLPKPDSNFWSIYRRLLRYAKPYIGVFLIGVLGMVLFAATQLALVYLVKTFLKGAFITKDPRVVWKVPIGVVVLFTLRGIGDYVANYYPSWVGGRSSRACGATCFRTICGCPRPISTASNRARCSPSSPTTSSRWRTRRPAPRSR